MLAHLKSSSSFAQSLIERSLVLKLQAKQSSYLLHLACSNYPMHQMLVNFAHRPVSSITSLSTPWLMLSPSFISPDGKPHFPRRNPFASCTRRNLLPCLMIPPTPMKHLFATLSPFRLNCIASLVQSSISYPCPIRLGRALSSVLRRVLNFIINRMKHEAPSTDWNLKLRIYTQLKERKAINNMLQIKCSTIKSPRYSQPSTTDRTKTDRTKHAPGKSYTPTQTERLLQVSPLQSPRQVTPRRLVRSHNASPVDMICPLSTQTPMQRYFKRDPIENFERTVLQKFLYNRWISEVIHRKSIHVNVPQRGLVQQTEKQAKLDSMLNLKSTNRFERLKRKRISVRQRLMWKIRVVCRIAKNWRVSLRTILAEINSQTNFKFFDHFKNCEFYECEQLIKVNERIVDLPDTSGDRALHQCVRRDNLPQLKYILSKHIDIEAKNYMLQTALDLAMQLNNHECQKVFLIDHIEMLLLSGASPWYVQNPNRLIKIAIQFRIRLICVTENKVKSESFDAYKKRLMDEMKEHLILKKQ